MKQVKYNLNDVQVTGDISTHLVILNTIDQLSEL